MKYLTRAWMVGTMVGTKEKAPCGALISYIVGGADVDQRIRELNPDLITDHTQIEK